MPLKKRRWPYAVVSVVAVLLGAATSALFAFGFAVSCAGQDTQPPPSPDSLAGTICEAGPVVELLLFGGPPIALLAGGVIATVRRQWAPLVTAAVVATLVLALSAV